MPEVRQRYFRASEELWRKVKSAAASAGKTVQQWVKEALEEKLDRET